MAGPLMASEALSLTAVELLADDALVAEAGRELARRVGGRGLSPPRFGDVGVMTRAPEEFWSAAWDSRPAPG